HEALGPRHLDDDRWRRRRVRRAPDGLGRLRRASRLERARLTLGPLALGAPLRLGDPGRLLAPPALLVRAPGGRPALDLADDGVRHLPVPDQPAGGLPAAVQPLLERPEHAL